VEKRGHCEGLLIKTMAEGNNARRALPSKENIGAVIITHHPGPDLDSLMRSISGQVGEVVLVDNHSGSEYRDRLQSLSAQAPCELILNSKNLGVAAALNQGIQLLAEHGFLWVLLLDQDSQSTPDLVERLCEGYSRLSHPDETALLAPKIVDTSTERESPFLTHIWGFLFRRTACSNTDIEDITTAITSGSLVRVAAFLELRGHREDFFIDYVDTEFCLRLQASGWRLAAICPAILYHRLGRRTKTRIGLFHLYPTHHPPWRWYTIGRNRVQMFRAYALRFPHWLAYECAASVFITARMLLTEKERIAKLRLLWRGSWDGLRGRMGPPATD
jgi:rhamnosyltransferase